MGCRRVPRGAQGCNRRECGIDRLVWRETLAETYRKGTGVERIECGHAINNDEPVSVELQLHQQLFAEGVDEVGGVRKRLAHGGSRHVRGRPRPSPHPCNWVSKLAIRIRRRGALPASARSGRARSAVVPRLWSACRQSTSQACAAPTVSAILAPRLPIGLGCPMVLSWAVWCSISALSVAPSRTTMIEIQIQ